MVPLSTLVNMRKAFGPEFTTRFNEYRSIEIFAAPAPGHSTGDAMSAVAAVANEVLPRDMGYRVERDDRTSSRWRAAARESSRSR